MLVGCDGFVRVGLGVWWTGIRLGWSGISLGVRLCALKAGWGVEGVSGGVRGGVLWEGMWELRVSSPAGRVRGEVWAAACKARWGCGETIRPKSSPGVEASREWGDGVEVWPIILPRSSGPLRGRLVSPALTERLAIQGFY